MSIQVTIDVATANALSKLKAFDKELKNLAKETVTRQGIVQKVISKEDLPAFKNIQESIKSTRKEIELLSKQSKVGGGVFDFSRAIKQLDAFEKKVDSLIPATAKKLSKTTVLGFGPEKIDKTLYQGVFDTATQAFAKTNVQIKQATENSKEYGRTLSNAANDAAKVFKGKMVEIVQSHKTGSKEITSNITANLKNTEKLLDPYRRKVSLLKPLQDVDTQIKNT